MRPRQQLNVTTTTSNLCQVGAFPPRLREHNDEELSHEHSQVIAYRSLDHHHQQRTNTGRHATTPRSFNTSGVVFPGSE